MSLFTLTVNPGECLLERHDRDPLDRGRRRPLRRAGGRPVRAGYLAAQVVPRDALAEVPVESLPYGSKLELTLGE